MGVMMMTGLTQAVLRQGCTRISDAPDSALINEKKELINKVFAAFEAIFPSQFCKYYGDGKDRVRTMAKRIWLHDEQFNALTAEQIRAGIGELSSREYMPTLGQFIKLCKPKPEKYGLPSTEQAWKEVNEKCHLVMQHSNSVQWSHNAVRMAGCGLWQRLGICNQIGADKVKKEFVNNYQCIVNSLLKGERLQGDAMVLEDRRAPERRQVIHSKMEIECILERQHLNKMSGKDARKRLLSVMRIAG